MKKFLFYCVLISLFISHTLNAQYLNIPVSNFGGFSNIGEESIMINPKNPNQIVIGVNTIHYTQGGQGYYYSANGGYNWSGNILVSNLGYTGTDPVIIVDTAGNFYFITLGNWGVPPPNLDKIICCKSTNGGINWSDLSAFALLAPKMNDKEYACVDFSNTSPYKNSFYVCWTLNDNYGSHNPLDSSYIYFCHSTNSGANFSTPIRICRQAGNCVDSSLTVEGAVPCTGPNGEIYTSWSGPLGIAFNRSTDGGDTWLNSETVVTEQVGGWYGNTHFPITACDISNSLYRGTVYICFADKRSGPNDRDIWLIKSTNKGNTWSNVIRVNNDAPGNDQYFPWMCIDPVTGYIYVVFYDKRNNPVLSEVYVARSTNGGNTFLNFKVSANPYLNEGYIGDYIGISAFNNKVRTTWAYAIPGNIPTVWAAIIDSIPKANIDHSPIQSGYDTSGKIASVYINSENPVGTGSKAPRLYYKIWNNSYNYVNAFSITQSLYKFYIPGQSRGTKITYYIAAQDSAGTYVVTLPAGGSGINPPGTTPPPQQFTYYVWTNKIVNSNTVPKPITGFLTQDTIHVQTPGSVVDVKVTLNLTHTNDGNLFISLKKESNTSSLSQYNGNGGQNFTNTIFDDSATIPITQGNPPFTGRFIPQTPLSVIKGLELSGDWILRIIDNGTGNTGTLINWSLDIVYAPTVTIHNNENIIPQKYYLYQNYPNPFNPVTKIKFDIPTDVKRKTSEVKLIIYDILGKEIQTLVNEQLQPGTYEVTFDGSNFASGVYFYQLRSGDFVETKKLVLLK